MWDKKRPVRPYYRTIMKPMLSKRLLMERVLYEMFVAFHRLNHLVPDPEGYYYVAISPNWTRWHVRLELKQTETNIIDTLQLAHIRKLPLDTVRLWVDYVKLGRTV